jgi:hypothetical protein
MIIFFVLDTTKKSKMDESSTCQAPLTEQAPAEKEHTSAEKEQSQGRNDSLRAEKEQPLIETRLFRFEQNIFSGTTLELIIQDGVLMQKIWLKVPKKVLFRYNNLFDDDPDTPTTNIFIDFSKAMTFEELVEDIPLTFYAYSMCSDLLDYYDLLADVRIPFVMSLVKEGSDMVFTPRSYREIFNHIGFVHCDNGSKSYEKEIPCHPDSVGLTWEVDESYQLTHPKAPPILPKKEIITWGYIR